jgi:asparaginyl-tRNA synthetase
MGAGSDSKPVHVNLLGAPTYLADSMQFMLEFGCRLAGADTYYVMPSFRGEDTDARHLAQFFHSEAELPGGLDDVIDVAQRYLVRLAGDFIARHEDLIASVAGTTAHVAALADGKVFRRLTFDEAVVVLDGVGVEQHDGWRSLSREGELELMRRVGQFTWVTHWDHLSVPFYQAYADEAGQLARNADLLFGIGETVGAGERHCSADQVYRALAKHEVDPEPYHWYADMRTEIPMQTSGFGLGVERFLLWLTDHDDIRDMQLLPRENGRVIVP